MTVFTASPLPADAVELGRFQDAWGIKGWLKIQPHGADTAALLANDAWYLTPPEARFARGFAVFSGPVQVQVAEVKAHADGWVARLEGVNDRNTAESLKGTRIYLSRSQFPALPEGEYYWIDLIGCQVRNREGVDLGLVTDLMATGPTSVLVMAYTETVEGEAKTLERLVPFVNAYVDEVNTAERRITVDWQPDY
jgi:16S rRNA processing protein RimM